MSKVTFLSRQPCGWRDLDCPPNHPSGQPLFILLPLNGLRTRYLSRAQLEEHIEALIDLLDLFDADCDLESDSCHEEWVQPLHLRGGAHVAA